VFSKVRERLALSKQEALKYNVQRFNLRKLSELEVMKKYRVKVAKRFVALENLYDREDTNGAWENIKGNNKTSAKERRSLHVLKRHKP
jgi:hypothetical protein